MTNKPGDPGLNPTCFFEIKLFLMKRPKTPLKMGLYRVFTVTMFGESCLVG